MIAICDFVFVRGETVLQSLNIKNTLVVKGTEVIVSTY